VQHVSERIEAGNIYINRNQIGAIVGSQPFGGEGLSGTGPKAGGPNYLPHRDPHPARPHGRIQPAEHLCPRADPVSWADAGRGGRTGPRGRGFGRRGRGRHRPCCGGSAYAYEQALALRTGPIVPLICGLPDPARVRAERHVCVDTTASGGNAALLGAMS